MQQRIGWITALTGAGAGLATWLISEPFIPTVTKSGTFTPYGSFSLGSFYGWFAHLMLGALIAGSLSYVISLTRTGQSTAIRAGLLGALLGGVLVCGADALSDWFSIKSLPDPKSFSTGSAMALSPILWHVSSCLALSMSIAIATQPTPARYRRALAAAFMAAIAGYMLRQAMAPFEEMRTLMSTDLSKLSGDNLDAFVAEMNRKAWQSWSPMRLVEWMSMGVIMGLALSLSDIFLRSATLRMESGRGTGTLYPLDNGENRVGTAEGLEVRLPFQEGVLPLHAIIDARQGHWAIKDVSGRGIGLNGHPIKEALFQEKDLAQIGPCHLRLYLGLEGRTVTYVPPEVTLLDTPTAVIQNHRLIDPFGGITQLAQGATVIGRGDSAQVRLGYDPKVVPQHALIEAAPATAHLHNLDPASTTWINGEPINQVAQLQNGDKIRVGSTTLEYRN